MKNIIILVAACVLYSASFGEAAAQSDCWPNFRGDARLSGLSGASIPASPRLLWNFRASDAIKAPPVVCDGIIVVGAVDGSLYGITTEGKMKWKINTGNGIESAAIIVGDRVFVGNLEGKVFALELQTGKTIWTYETEGMIMGAPNFWSGASGGSGGAADRRRQGEKMPGGTDGVVVIGSYDYYLHGIDARTGKGLWKYEADNFINGAPAIFEGMAVFGGCDGLLHKVDVRDGSSKGRHEVATYVAGSAAVDNGMTFVGDYDGKFTCLDIRKNSVVWDFQSEEVQQPFIASPSITNDRVYIGSRDKFVYCFNRKNGTLEWKKNTRGAIDASPVLTRDALIVANLRGDVMMLDPKDGRTLWNYETGSAIAGNPAVIDDRIFVTASDGRIYCFGK